MPFNFKYMPVFRSRQQELLVLKSFNFENGIFPLLEIIKERDRVNNNRLIEEIWSDYVVNTQSEKILVDLPVYIRDTSSMQDEVLAFNRTTLSNIDRRIAFFRMLAPLQQKVIPVVSSLLLKTGEANTIASQIQALRGQFQNIAVRTFTNTLESDFDEIREHLTANDILIYDLDTVQPLNPLVKKQMRALEALNVPYKIAVRSAINTEIQNVKLDHGEVIADADNSLQELFHSNLKMNGFGDYAGIKKDDLNSGGTISPGFIFYDPIDNLYYGYKGGVKSLSEFEDTIVPAVLNSNVITRLRDEYPEYITDNTGYNTLLAIQNRTDSGKSQAKFKRISIEHYLHCMKVKVRQGEFD